MLGFYLAPKQQGLCTAVQGKIQQCGGIRSNGITSKQAHLCIYGPRQANLVLIAYASSEGSGEPAHLRIQAESRGTFRQKVRSLAPLNGWACTVKICHDGMLEDTNSLDTPHIQ